MVEVEETNLSEKYQFEEFVSPIVKITMLKCLDRDPSKRIAIQNLLNILFKEVYRKSMALIADSKILGETYPFWFNSK